MENKNITIDDLARMVQGGFDGVDKKFEGVEKRFDEVDKKFEGVEKRLDRIEIKLEGIVYRREFEKLESRVVELENLLAMNTQKR